MQEKIERKISNLKVWFMIFAAFVFSVVVRLIWVYQFKDTSGFMWNNQFMINTNDGYFWAEGARDILNGFHQPNDLSPISQATSKLTAIFASVLPFSFETIIFYMPAFLSSLVVVPVILIAQSLKRVEIGFVAALIASIVWSYYNRTMVGYYDTDMLNIVLPTFLLWSIIALFQKREEKYILLVGLEIIAYRWWYPQSYSLEFSFFGLIFLYTIVFERKNTFNYKLLAMMLFAMMNLPSLYRVGIVLIIFMGYKSKRFDSYIYYLLGVAFISFLATGGVLPIWLQLKGYVFKSSIESSVHGLGLHFFSVMQTVREAGHIPFETFANRISGNTAIFLASCVGYVLMVFRYPVMLFGAPMLGLGFLAYVGGLRFTIYAVPICAFGASYLIFYVSDYLRKFIIDEKKSLIAGLVFVSVCTVAILYPNIKHIMAYKVPTVFRKQEVQVLDKLKHIASREDYVVSWWDFGYPIRYYADVKTLIDGGKHSGKVNFPVSYMLTHSQEVAAKLARLDVEYTEKSFHYEKNNPKKRRSYIENMTLDYGFKDTNKFLDKLKTDIKLPKKTRNIYFYLPFRMMGIFPTVAKFSNIDLMSGNTTRRPFFYQTRRYSEGKNGLINLANGVYFDQKKGLLRIRKQLVPLRAFYMTYYDKKGKLVRQKQMLHKDSNISIIYMKTYRTFLVLSQDILNSLYIQLFVFDNYDKKLFEPVILTPSAKVYKLKL